MNHENRERLEPLARHISVGKFAARSETCRSFSSLLVSVFPTAACHVSWVSRSLLSDLRYISPFRLFSPACCLRIRHVSELMQFLRLVAQSKIRRISSEWGNVVREFFVSPVCLAQFFSLLVWLPGTLPIGYHTRHASAVPKPQRAGLNDNLLLLLELQLFLLFL